MKNQFNKYENKSQVEWCCIAGSPHLRSEKSKEISLTLCLKINQLLKLNLGGENKVEGRDVEIPLPTKLYQKTIKNDNVQRNNKSGADVMA